jgi:hypothetical protein
VSVAHSLLSSQVEVELEFRDETLNGDDEEKGDAGLYKGRDDEWTFRKTAESSIARMVFPFVLPSFSLSSIFFFLFSTLDALSKTSRCAEGATLQSKATPRECRRRRGRPTLLFSCAVERRFRRVADEETATAQCRLEARLDGEERADQSGERCRNGRSPRLIERKTVKRRRERKKK